MSLNVDALATDIEKNGQDFPIIVRPRDGKDTYQLICGFRRMAALKKLGRTNAQAIVRELSDDDALRLSWAENEQRRSYTEFDRANAIVKARRTGRKMDELEKLFGLTERQIRRLELFGKMPKQVHDAVASDSLKTTHAVVLIEMKRRYEDLDLKEWIEAIPKEDLSVRSLKRRLTKQYGKKKEPVQFFSESDGVLKLKRVKVDFEKISDDEKMALREMAKRVLDLVGE